MYDFTVFPGTPCYVRKVGDKSWKAHKTTTQTTFKLEGTKNDAGTHMTFVENGWEIKVAIAHVNQPPKDKKERLFGKDARKLHRWMSRAKRKR